MLDPLQIISLMVVVISDSTERFTSTKVSQPDALVRMTCPDRLFSLNISPPIILSSPIQITSFTAGPGIYCENLIVSSIIESQPRLLPLGINNPPE